MKIIKDATRFTSPGTGPNHWTERYRSPHMSVGTYSIPTGGLDDQHRHTEEEIYVVITGQAKLVTGDGAAEVSPGSVVQIPAGEAHRFEDIEEDLTLLVVFAPPYGSAPSPDAAQRGDEPIHRNEQ
jgi:quercetin dioxygenase-like cupin family protein